MGFSPALFLEGARVAALLLSTAASPDVVSDGTAAFERLKSLAGDWSGSLQWSGARTGSGSVSARYYLTGLGSALIEDLEMDGKIAMTSVYHLDGRDLRLTHYCASANQPRLKASSLDDQNGSYRFAFVDITNLKTPMGGHVSSVDIQLHSPRQMTLTFTFTSGAGESYERIDLTRASNAAS